MDSYGRKYYNNVMSSNFSFGGISTKSKKQILDLNKVNSTVLLDKTENKASYNCTPVILVEEAFSEECLKGISLFLESSGLTRYRVLCAINCEADKRIVESEGKIKFYKSHKSDFEKYLTNNEPIITAGPALYSLLMEDDVYPSYMQQIIFGKSNFLFSKDLTRENCHRVFPIESLREIFARGFNKPVDSYKTKLAQIQINNVIRLGDNPIPRYPKLNKIFIHNKDEFENLFYLPNKDRRNDIVAWDLETSGLSFLKDEIGCITLSFDGITGYYIPWRIMKGPQKKQLGEILKNNIQALANGKFDIKFLWRNGVPEARVDEDVIQLGHMLDETRSNSLKTLSFLYTEFGGYERVLDSAKDKLGKGKSINYIKDIPENILWDYAVMDAIVTRRVLSNLLEHIRYLDKKYPNEFYPEDTMERYYYYRKIPVENMYAKIEYRGCYVDKTRLDDLRVEMSEYLKNLKHELSNMFNVSEDFDWSSNQQLGKLLEEKGWENLGRAKAGMYSTADFQLERWSKTHPEAKKLQTMRSVAVLLHSFVGDQGKKSIFSDFIRENTSEQYLEEDGEGEQGWSQYLTYHPEDDSWRISADYRSLLTDSHRTKCGSPNFQNVPARGLFSHEIKRCLVTPDNDKYYMVTVDYASLQARLGAIDTWAPTDNLVKVLSADGADLHSATGFHCFSENKEYDVEEITVTQDGVDYHYLGGEQVLTQRGVIFARDLVEEDTLMFK